MKRIKDGFTMVELLIVVSIMGILTVITASQFNTAKMKARDVSRKGDMNSVSKALMMYFADYGTFPPDTGAVPLNINNMWGLEFVDKGYVYMKVMPKENASGIPPYCYVVSADQKSFALFADIENKQDKDCSATTQSHCGGNEYCYSFVSPNASVTDFALLNP